MCQNFATPGKFQTFIFPILPISGASCWFSLTLFTVFVGTSGMETLGCNHRIHIHQHDTGVFTFYSSSTHLLHRNWCWPKTWFFSSLEHRSMGIAFLCHRMFFSFCNNLLTKKDCESKKWNMVSLNQFHNAALQESNPSCAQVELCSHCSPHSWQIMSTSPSHQGHLLTGTVPNCTDIHHACIHYLSLCATPSPQSMHHCSL